MSSDRIHKLLKSLVDVVVDPPETEIVNVWLLPEKECRNDFSKFIVASAERIDYDGFSYNVRLECALQLQRCFDGWITLHHNLHCKKWIQISLDTREGIEVV